MTGDGSTDLPDDLLGAIYRCCSSFYDQARFAVVCTSWRAAASWQPKRPALPLLLPSTGNGRLDRKARAYCPEEGRVLRAPLPWFPYGKRIVGSYDGGWVAAAIGCRIEIVNLFTRDWVPSEQDFPCRCPNTWQTNDKITIEKVIFSEDPTRQGCIMAAMTTRCAIAVCRLGFPRGWWTTGGCEIYMRLVDIAFCNDELYGLSRTGQLYKLAISRGEYGAPVGVLFLKLAITSPIGFDPLYIFQLGGKLALAVIVRSYKARVFMVFELVIDDAEDKYTWAEVTSLGDDALFLGPGCCKAVQVSAMGRRGAVERNRIYYSNHEGQLPNDKDPECLDKFNLGSCDVYSYENKQTHPLERITSRGYHYGKKYDGINGRNSCTWILPPLF